MGQAQAVTQRLTWCSARVRSAACLERFTGGVTPEAGWTNERGGIAVRWHEATTPLDINCTSLC
jgi:hypothetical protein